MLRTDLEKYTEELLEISRFRDYCPNGLQVEGRDEIKTIISGVTASLEFLEAAIEAGADALMVHHGYFWKGENARVIGIKRKRLALLLQHNINLFAYHLPLDAHPELGNNVQLARHLELQPSGQFGEQNLGWYGSPAAPLTLKQLTRRISEKLNRSPLVIGNEAALINKIGWCTGGAQSYFEEAIEQGVQAFITGEVSEQQFHLARETGVAFISAGHHATERYGIQALGAHLSQHFGLKHQFIDLDNPV